MLMDKQPTDKQLANDNWANDVLTKVMVQNDLQIDAIDLPQSIIDVAKALPFDEQMLAVLTLASQYRQMLLIPAPTEALSGVPELPSLTKPTLPSQWHMLIKNYLSTAKYLRTTGNNEEAVVALVRLVASRGYSMHPSLWLPTKAVMEHYLAGELVDLYMPWYTWQHHDNTPHSELSADNWDSWYPAQRLALLRAWRANEPDKVRELLQACLPQESASERYKIVQVLASNLSLADQDFLLALQSDRSQKVAIFASQLLERLGVCQDGQDDNTTIIDELNEVFEFANKKITAKKLNNHKRRDNRSKLLTQVNVRQWARANGLTMSQFVLRWDFAGNNYGDNLTLMGNVVDTLSDAEAQVLGERLAVYLSKHSSEMELWRLIYPRLNPATRWQCVDNLLQKDVSFVVCLMVSLDVWPMDFDTLFKTPAYQCFIKKVKAQMNKKANYFLDDTTDDDCTALGLLVSSDTAKAVLAELLGLGVRCIDPALRTLMLNAKLA